MSRDLRQFTRNTQIRLIGGFLLLVFLVGDGLITVFYGPRAGLMGLACLVGALVPVGMVVLVLGMMDRAVKRRD